MGWGVLAVFVTAVDVHAVSTGRPTLSAAYRSGFLAHPVVVTLATAYMVAHLHGAWPARLDPLCRFAAIRTPRGHHG